MFLVIVPTCMLLVFVCVIDECVDCAVTSCGRFWCVLFFGVLKAAFVCG